MFLSEGNLRRPKRQRALEVTAEVVDFLSGFQVSFERHIARPQTQDIAATLTLAISKRRCDPRGPW